MMNITQQIASW